MKDLYIIGEMKKQNVFTSCMQSYVNATRRGKAFRVVKVS
jgi:hypothetical protein